MHYGRLKRAGLPDRPQLSPRVCSVEGCERKHNTRGYCYTHYVRFKATGSPGTGEIRVYEAAALRDDHGRKRCRSCREWKTLDNYWSYKNTADGFSPRCKRCKRGQKLVDNFGITLGQYEQMAAEQGGGCAICGDRPDVLHVDHDHACCPEKGKSCGKCIRALTCGNCNTALGLMRDDPHRLEAAVAYLRRHAHD